MKPSLTVLLSKPLFSLDLVLNTSKMSSFSTLPLFPWVSKLPDKSWLFSSPVTPPSPLRSLRPSPPTLKTNLVSSFKSSKVKDPWPRTTISSVNSISTELPLLPEVFLRLKSPSILMRTVSSTLPLLIKVLPSPTRSPLPTKRVVFPKKKSTVSSRKLRNSRLRTNPSRRRSKLRTLSKTTPTPSETPSRTRSSRTSSKEMRRRMSKNLLMKYPNGLSPTTRLKLKNTLPSKNNLKISSTPLWWEFTKLLVVFPLVLKVSPVVLVSLVVPLLLVVLPMSTKSIEYSIYFKCRENRKK